MRLIGNSMPNIRHLSINLMGVLFNHYMETKKYILKKTGEEVAEEKWGWCAIYKDNTELRQFDPSGEFHQVGEINQDELYLFSMYQVNDPSKRIDLIVPQGAKIIHKYRNIKPFYKESFLRIYLFGYKKGDQYAYHAILPDDRIVIADTDAMNLELFNL